VDGAVPQRLGKRLVDEAVLIEQRQPVEARARHGHLEVVAAAGPVIDGQHGRVGKRVAEQRFEPVGSHATMLDAAEYPVAVDEIGLFPLGIVLLPTEIVPLHVFEDRYKELIGECLELEQEFGLVYADEDGVRETGTRARVADVIERFDDGRMNVLVEGVARFKVSRLTRGRSFMTAEVETVEDEWDEPDPEAVVRATESFRALAAAVEAEPAEPDETSPRLSFELAATVELPVDSKQELLELRSEQARLALLADLLDAALAGLEAARELESRAKQNGSRLH
jgi:Lon protease-like protein